MRKNVDVITLVCRVNTSSWGYEPLSSWNDCNCDYNNSDFDNDCVIVECCSDRRIQRGSSCTQAIERLLNLGYKLINTVTLDSDCCGQIVYTFARYSYNRDECNSQQPEYDNCSQEESETNTCSGNC
jgi:hypothetical protein